MRMAHPAWLGVLALSGLLTAQSVQAQAGHSGNGLDQIELTRANIQNRRQEIVQQIMELTPAQSEKFWPVYRDYRNEIARVGDQRVELIEKFVQQAATMSDEQSEKLLHQWFSLREQQIGVQKKYAGQFRKLLPGAKVVRFYQTENLLDTIVSANIQASMPVAGDSGSH
jgi:Spy/CpxP family protein refolding chaperone